jgi:hypothetical protein
MTQQQAGASQQEQLKKKPSFKAVALVVTALQRFKGGT